MRKGSATLLSRTAWTIAAAILLSQITGTWLFRHYYLDWRAAQTADLLWERVQGVMLAVHDLTPFAQRVYLDALQREQTVTLGQPPAVISKQGPFWTAIQARLQSRSPWPLRFTRGRDGVVLWVHAGSTGTAPWVAFPVHRVERPFPWPLFLKIALVSSFSLLGALLVVRRINRPLRALIAAAQEVGQGRHPQRLEVRGPRELQEVSRAFNRMTRDVQRLEHDRRLLLAGVSHDLRTPLARLRLAVEMLDADPALQQGMVADVDEMDAILGQFLAFIREGTEETARPSDLNALVETVAGRFQRHGAALHLDLAPLPRLWLRPLAMERLISNLINNAVRYAGGDIDIQTRAENTGVRLSVLDRGPGISAELHERVLRPFVRLDASRHNDSAGLGLAIVSRIASLHEARFTLHDRPGGGLEARLELPADQAGESVSK